MSVHVQRAVRSDWNAYGGTSVDNFDLDCIEPPNTPFTVYLSQAHTAVLAPPLTDSMT